MQSIPDDTLELLTYCPIDLRPASPIVWKAAMLAVNGHGRLGQRRRGSRAPYVSHCERVATAVSDANMSDCAVAAAWVHDLVEDTLGRGSMEINLQEIEDVLGKTVAGYVHALTNPPAAPGLNRAARKEIELRMLRDAPVDVVSIRYAEIADNVADMMRTDLNFASVYVPEKRRLLEAVPYGHKGLYQTALSVVEQAENELLAAQRPQPRRIKP
jgi:(p)ppGpp synthase/HD superfamily hydrolase